MANGGKGKDQKNETDKDKDHAAAEAAAAAEVAALATPARNDGPVSTRILIIPSRRQTRINQSLFWINQRIRIHPWIRIDQAMRILTNLHQ